MISPSKLLFSFRIIRSNPSNTDVLLSLRQHEPFDRTKMEDGNRSQGFNESHPILAPKWSSARKNRLLLSGTRLIFNLIRLGLLLGFNSYFGIVLIPDISINGFLVLWDILERFCFKSDTSHATISTISVATEAVIPPGIIVFMGITLWQLIKPQTIRDVDDGVDYEVIEPSPVAYDIITEISMAILWAPVVFLSGILFYHLLRGYVRKWRDHKLRPILMFTQTGDPVAIIPRVQHPNDRDRESRGSIDSLIQTSGESAL
ncbi:uncharacterized protein F4812DRAFT_437300 [Daldinia caldariorum]|uniref:uncharacterized protein n=1 Tax=Daldinia caldariorum TaxID=326644 RepID=UPI002008C92D|nr:uncharacterized protein F4812DRAFT_437300 [Daldinia caldariorum]KAI1465717.1 hypothetical protein F4812DRAFT_437300 [Daldinia caldariorum]